MQLLICHERVIMNLRFILTLLCMYRDSRGNLKCFFVFTIGPFTDYLPIRAISLICCILMCACIKDNIKVNNSTSKSTFCADIQFPAVLLSQNNPIPSLSIPSLALKLS
jgi:hypothetical protein